MSRMPHWKLPCPTGYLPLALALLAGLPLAAATPRARLQPVQLPLGFEANQGQTAAPVQYLARSQGAVVFLTARGATVKTIGQTAGFEFAGARAAQAKGEGRLGTGVNYFIGGQRADWRTGVPAYQQVRYRDLYPGVDVVYYGHDGQLEYDLRVAPRADLGAVQLKATGVGGVIGRDGSLRLGAMELRQPVAYQMEQGRRQAVPVRYVAAADGGFKLAAGPYDHTRALVIDPVLVFSTLLGGTSFNQANAVAVDASGAAYVSGYTLSTDFPTAGGLTPNAPNGDFDAFVTKVAPDGKSLVYSTYLGGALEDRATGIAVDGSGDAFVTGFTLSANFPVVGGVQAANKGSFDGFVAKLNPAGSALIYSTYLGGTQDDKPSGIAVDSFGDALVTGITTSPDYPTSATAPQTALVGGQDAFVTALNPAGSAVLYSTYIGGHALVNGVETGVTAANAIAVDASGNAYVAGSTNATTGFPVTAGALEVTNQGGIDAFVAMVQRTGTRFQYVTYLGGSKKDEANAIAVDLNGDAFVAGDTSSSDLFTKASLNNASSFQQSLSGSNDAFVTELNNSGSSLVFGTYLDGQQTSRANGIALDINGNVYVVGSTTSTQFPVTSNAQQATPGKASDAFFTKFDSVGVAQLYSTYLGGIANDFANGVALDPSGDVLVVGATSSSDFPVTAGSFQTTVNSPSDAFVAKFASAAQGVFSPTSIGFVAQSVNVASAATAVQFTNGGEKPLIISSIKLQGPYTETDNCNANNSTLQPTANCTINVVFKPTATGAQNGELDINDNSPAGVEKLAITGTGGAFTVTAAPTTITLSAGSSASFAFNVTPAIGYTQVVTLSCKGAPANSTCVPSPTSLTMNGTSASTATFTVTTTVRPAGIPPLFPSNQPWMWLGLAGLGLTGLGLAYAMWSRSARRKLGWAGVAILAGWTLAAAGCGGTQQNPGTPAGTYNLVLTGTAGSTTQSVTVQLVVD